MSSEDEKLTAEEKQQVQDFFDGVAPLCINKYIQSMTNLYENTEHGAVINELNSLASKPEGAIENQAKEAGMTSDMADFRDAYNEINQKLMTDMVLDIKNGKTPIELEKLNSVIPLVSKAVNSGEVDGLLPFPIDTREPKFANFNSVRSAGLVAEKIHGLTESSPSEQDHLGQSPLSADNASQVGSPVDAKAADPNTDTKTDLKAGPNDDPGVDPGANPAGKAAPGGVDESPGKNLAENVYDFIESFVKKMIELILKLLEAIFSGAKKGLSTLQERSLGSAENATPAVAAQKTIDNTPNVTKIDPNQSQSVQNSAQRNRGQSMD